MTASTVYRSGLRTGRDGFAQLLHAEWTKFRTVRGWVIGAFIAVMVAAGLGLFAASSGATSSCRSAGGGPARSGAACAPVFTIGPGGEPVDDSFYFVHKPLTANGRITVRVTSLTGLVLAPTAQNVGGMAPGLEPWAKAGIIVKESLQPGSAYAAMLVTGGHGVRMQWNFTGDTAGLPGAVGASQPRWLRLTRSGDVLTGYDSADGTHWTEVGAVTLSGLPSAVQAGLFATSPFTSSYAHVPGKRVLRGGITGPTQDTAVFDHVDLAGAPPGSTWTAVDLGGSGGGDHQAGGRFTVTGTGDIAPIPPGHGGPADSATTISDFLLGTFGGLIALAVVAALFITGEYRRGLIRVTLTASPSRSRVLAAKAVVAGAVSFAAGLAGAVIAVLAGGAVTRDRGYYLFPVPGLTELRVIICTGLLAALVGVLALAVGTAVRRGAAAIAIIIVVFVLPYFLAVAAVVPVGAADWLLRITPAAGFAVQGAYPQYQQVTPLLTPTLSALYSPQSGYYPLAPWAGLAVLCAWTAVALAAADRLLRRRDA